MKNPFWKKTCFVLTILVVSKPTPKWNPMKFCNVVHCSLECYIKAFKRFSNNYWKNNSLDGLLLSLQFHQERTSNVMDLLITSSFNRKFLLRGCVFLLLFQNIKPIFLKLFHVTGLFLYPLKTENLWFSDVFRGYRKRSMAWTRLILFIYLSEYLCSATSIISWISKLERL